MKEYFLDDKCTQYIEETENGRLRVTLYYGPHRQFAIRKAGIEPNGNIPKAIKGALKELREAKKHVTPMHGCTSYI